MNSIRVALVDHQQMFSRGLELLLPALTDSRVRVVASTDDASAASLLVRRHMPDLAVVDLDLPAPGGLRAIAAIRRTEPGVPVLAMADLDPANQDDDTADRAIAALQAGAEGFMHKTGEPEGLVAPLMAAVDGWAVLPSGVVKRMLQPRPPETEQARGLGNADRTLWRLIAAGRTTQQIARELHVSERTVKRLTAALLRKLGVASRIEAAALAGRTRLEDSSAVRAGGGR